MTLSTIDFDSSTDDDDFELSYDIRSSGLLERYRSIERGDPLEWRIRYRDLRLVGSGGQGIVLGGMRVGADGFRLPVTVKVFSPAVYGYVEDYVADMERIAHVSAKVAALQHDHLLAIHQFSEQDGIRLMVMEWINGFNLQQLLHRDTLAITRRVLNKRQTEHFENVVVAEGPSQSRFKPGIAIQILRECLMGLGALHRYGVVHGDVKPSNIMLKRTGNTKIVDIGSAVDLHSPRRRRAWTPTYAAPEVLAGEANSPRSDLASLGYVLIEMLSGEPPFKGILSIEDLLEAKRALPGHLETVLPEDVLRNETLVHLCGRLIAIDPEERISTAEEANLDGAARFHRELVHSSLDSDYENDIRVWIDALPGTLSA